MKNKWILFLSAAIPTIVTNSFAAANILIYPISLHYFRGIYFIGDSGREAILRYKNGTLPSSLNTAALPVGITDDGNRSVIQSGPSACSLYKFDIYTGNWTQFSPSSSTQNSFCSRVVTKYANGLYAFTSGDHIIVRVDSSGIQTKLTAKLFESPFGITPFIAEDKTPSFAVADVGNGTISTINQNGKKTPLTISNCGGEKLEFPFSVVALNNRLYFDDAILNTLFSYDIKTKQCVKISNKFIKPMGMAITGNKIGILDAGERALIEYDPETHILNTLYQDNSSDKSLVQPWDFYVTPTDVFVSDYQRSAILKITKKIPHTISIITSANHGTGAPFINIAAIAGSNDTFYLSDASEDVIFHINPHNGDRTFYSGTTKNSGKGFDDPVTMTLYKNNLYVADWGNVAVMKVTANGNRTILANLKSPPFGISSVLDGSLYVTQPMAGTITKVSVTTGQSSTLALNCPDLKSPFGIVSYDKNTLFVDDNKKQQINRIDLSSNTCQKIATIPTGQQRLWLMKQYDEDHLIVGISYGNKLYLVNIKTGKVSLFL